MPVPTERTQVAVIGAGPAGLMAAHLLHLSGVETVVVERRSVSEIASTQRAGILEANSVRLLCDSGVGDRVLSDGVEHRGIDLRFGGRSHRIDFAALVGASCWLYPQTEVFVDLHRARVRDGGQQHFGVSEVHIDDCSGTARSALVSYVDEQGSPRRLAADFVLAADGSRSTSRELIDGATHHSREYPFAWFGILAEAPRSADELVYARSPHGFALVSQRTDSVQRMYFQCEPGTDPTTWSDDAIWSELDRRLAGEDDFRLRTGPIIDRAVLGFRSFVQTPMWSGRLLLAGDAAHTVPPTGAKGLNLALADAALAAEALERAVLKGDPAGVQTYSERAQARVWRAQHFSSWMTAMLHRSAASGDAEAAFDEHRRLGELEGLVGSVHGSAYLAEAYTGWVGRD